MHRQLKNADEAESTDSGADNGKHGPGDECMTCMHGKTASDRGGWVEDT